MPDSKAVIKLAGGGANQGAFATAPDLRLLNSGDISDNDICHVHSLKRVYKYDAADDSTSDDSLDSIKPGDLDPSDPGIWKSVTQLTLDASDSINSLTGPGGDINSYSWAIVSKPTYTDKGDPSSGWVSLVPSPAPPSGNGGLTATLSLGTGDNWVSGGILVHLIVLDSNNVQSNTNPFDPVKTKDNPAQLFEFRQHTPKTGIEVPAPGIRGWYDPYIQAFRIFDDRAFGLSGLSAALDYDRATYVSKTRADPSGDGTTLHPYATLQEAIDDIEALLPGPTDLPQTIIITDGADYDEDIIISRGIRFVAPFGATIVGTSSPATMITVNSPEDVVFDGINIRPDSLNKKDELALDVQAGGFTLNGDLNLKLTSTRRAKGVQVAGSSSLTLTGRISSRLSGNPPSFTSEAYILAEPNSVIQFVGTIGGIHLVRKGPNGLRLDALVGRTNNIDPVNVKDGHYVTALHTDHYLVELTNIGGDVYETPLATSGEEINSDTLHVFDDNGERLDITLDNQTGDGGQSPTIELGSAAVGSVWAVFHLSGFTPSGETSVVSLAHSQIEGARAFEYANTTLNLAYVLTPENEISGVFQANVINPLSPETSLTVNRLVNSLRSFPSPDEAFGQDLYDYLVGLQTAISSGTFSSGSGGFLLSRSLGDSGSAAWDTVTVGTVTESGGELVMTPVVAETNSVAEDGNLAARVLTEDGLISFVADLRIGSTGANDRIVEIAIGESGDASPKPSLRLELTTAGDLVGGMCDTDGNYAGDGPFTLYTGAEASEVHQVRLDVFRLQKSDDVFEARSYVDDKFVGSLSAAPDSTYPMDLVVPQLRMYAVTGDESISSNWDNIYVKYDPFGLGIPNVRKPVFDLTVLNGMGGFDGEEVIDLNTDLVWRYDGSTWINPNTLASHSDLLDLGEDDHPQYQLRSEQDLPNGYPSLDASGNLADYQRRDEQGIPDGYPNLDSSGKVPASQLPLLDIASLLPIDDVRVATVGPLATGTYDPYGGDQISPPLSIVQETDYDTTIPDTTLFEISGDLFSFVSEGTVEIVDTTNPSYDDVHEIGVVSATEFYINVEFAGNEGALGSVKFSNGSFIGAPTSIDGVSLDNGDRVLVKDQLDSTQNGVYEVIDAGTGEWHRTTDSLGHGTTATALEGTLNENTKWTVITFSVTQVGKVDGDQIIWVILDQFSQVTIPTPEDKGKTPSDVTGVDDGPTGITLTLDPVSGGYIGVSVNGVWSRVGNGTATGVDCYFGASPGVAKSFNNVTVGDQLYWNATISGLDLDGDDRIDIHYEVTSG